MNMDSSNQISEAGAQLEKLLMPEHSGSSPGPLAICWINKFLSTPPQTH